jgi:hypothetical protein
MKFPYRYYPPSLVTGVKMKSVKLEKNSREQTVTLYRRFDGAHYLGSFMVRMMGFLNYRELRMPGSH